MTRIRRLRIRARNQRTELRGSAGFAALLLHFLQFQNGTTDARLSLAMASAQEFKTDFSTAIHRQEVISTGKSPKSTKTEDTLLMAFSPFGDIEKQSTSECSSLAVKFDFEESTAHSRDVLELNLRRLSGSISCAPKARERKRSSLNCTGGRKATRGHQEYSPRNPACMAGTGRVYFCAKMRRFSPVFRLLTPWF